MTRANRPWSPAETKALHDNTHLTVHEIAALIGRSKEGVWAAAQRFGLTLATPKRAVRIAINGWPLCMVPDLQAGLPLAEIAAKFNVKITAARHHVQWTPDIRAAFLEGLAVRKAADLAARAERRQRSEVKAAELERRAAAAKASREAKASAPKKPKAAKPKPVRRKGTGGWRGGAKPTSFRDERVIGDADIAATYLRQMRYIPVIADASKIYGRALAGQSIVGRLKMPVQDMIAKAVGLGLRL